MVPIRSGLSVGLGGVSPNTVHEGAGCHRPAARILCPPPRRYDRSVIRPRPLMAISFVAGATFVGCNSTPPPAKVSPTIPGTSKGTLPVKVTSVKATLEPYNPQFGNQGIPAEEVNFTVNSVRGSFSCRIEVVRSDRIVGSTTATMGPPSGGSSSVTESVPVEGIKGGTFAGNPSNAHVVCRP